MSTATDNCAATPTGGDHSTVGDGITGGAYWTSWPYDAVGNRLTQTRHTVTTSGYSSAQPNPLTGTSTTGGSTGSTSYIYDADGNLLLQTDPTTTTLCVGSEQITITLDDSAGTVTGGATVVRTGAGTLNSLCLDSTGQSPTWRQFADKGACVGLDGVLRAGCRLGRHRSRPAATMNSGPRRTHVPPVRRTMLWPARSGGARDGGHPPRRAPETAVRPTSPAHSGRWRLSWIS
ncbi:hypothetical protein [Streptomyces fulvoviolaceus]|uniref:hypothetical protein n=1 Tax=Streptomyces fulvoviolaceus TaxID=285535 RepID=UPI0004C4FC5C|nr:hypothetical protein [Streptomyces fulvoviolaceus]